MTIPTSTPTPQAPTGTHADADAPGNLATHLAALAERRGWGDRIAFHQGHRAWTHGEVHELRRAGHRAAGEAGADAVHRVRLRAQP
ncbi:acyl-CoA synthase, partial [Streptomyces sp. NPDC057927]